MRLDLCALTEIETIPVQTIDEACGRMWMSKVKLRLAIDGASVAA